MLAWFLVWLQSHQPDAWIYPAMSAVSFLETLFPPFPGDVLFIVMSGWASKDDPVISSLLLSSMSGFIGCFAASVVIILVGRRFGRGRVRAFILSRVGSRRLEKAESLISKRSGLMLLVSRFMPGIRSLLVLVAGYSGMKPSLAALYGGVSALLWYCLMSAAGMELGYNLTAVGRILNRYEILVWAALGIALTAWIVTGIARHSRRRSVE